MVVCYDWLMKTYARVFVCLQLKYFFSRLVTKWCSFVVLWVTTFLENLEMSEIWQLSGKSQGIDQKSGKCPGKILSEKTVDC